MAEILSIAGPDEPSVLARLEIETNARPGLQARVVRRGNFELCALRVVTAGDVQGNDGLGFRQSSGDLFAVVVQFT